MKTKNLGCRFSRESQEQESTDSYCLFPSTKRVHLRHLKIKLLIHSESKGHFHTLRTYVSVRC